MPLPDSCRAVRCLNFLQCGQDSVPDQQAGRPRVGMGSAGRLVDHTVDNA